MPSSLYSMGAEEARLDKTFVILHDFFARGVIARRRRC